MSSEPPQFKSVILAQQVDKIFERIAHHSVRTTYEADQMLLLQYLERAQHLDDPTLQSRILNILGVLHSTQGQAARAIATYQESFEVSQRNNYLRGQITSVYNQAGVHFGQGEFDRVIERCQLALSLIDPTLLEERFILNIRLNTFSTLAMCYTLLHQFAAAREEIETFFDVWNNPILSNLDRENLAGMLRVVRRARAMIEIVEGDFPEAADDIKLVMELSQQTQAHSYTVTGYLLNIMLALRDPTHQTPAEDYWSQAEALVAQLLAANDTTLWYIGNHSYLECAGEFEYLGLRPWAMRCAQKAITVLSAVEDTVRRDAAAQLLRHLQSAENSGA